MAASQKGSREALVLAYTDESIIDGVPIDDLLSDGAFDELVLRVVPFRASQKLYGPISTIAIEWSR